MSALEAALREEEAHAAVTEQKARAATLEERHRANDTALAAVQKAGTGQMLMCTGREAFVNLTKEQVKRLLEKENARLWESVDDAQRKLHTLKNRAEAAAELAAIAREVEQERLNGENGH